LPMRRGERKEISSKGMIAVRSEVAFRNVNIKIKTGIHCGLWRKGCAAKHNLTAGRENKSSSAGHGGGLLTCQVHARHLAERTRNNKAKESKGELMQQLYLRTGGQNAQDRGWTWKTKGDTGSEKGVPETNIRTKWKKS